MKHCFGVVQITLVYCRYDMISIIVTLAVSIFIWLNSATCSNEDIPSLDTAYMPGNKACAATHWVTDLHAGAVDQPDH